MKIVKDGRLNFILNITGLLLILYSGVLNKDNLSFTFWIGIVLIISSLVLSIRYHRCSYCGAWLNFHLYDSYKEGTCPKCGKKIEKL